MCETPDLEATRKLMLDLGFTDLDVLSHPHAFGSWYIEARSNERRIRVVWDGRDGCLMIQRPSLSQRPDDWADRWIAGEGYSKKIDDLRDGLIEVMKLES